MKVVLKKLLVLAGFISLGLGVVGIFLPLLPTTPFLLLASFCFLRGSTRLHDWLIHHRLFGEFIRNYEEKRTIPMKVKVSALVLLWISIILSACLIGKTVVAVILSVIALAVSIHIVSIKSG